MLLAGIPLAAPAAAGDAATPDAPAAAAQQGDVQLARLSPGFLREMPDRTVLPRPLSASDADMYRRLFALQAEERYDMVDRLIRLVDNRMLLGHLLAERYLDHRGYKASFQELAQWLERYGDHPRAERIHALAAKRRPAGAVLPKPFTAPAVSPAQPQLVEDGASYVSGLERPKSVARKVAKWRRQIPELIRNGKLDQARSELSRADVLPLLDAAELDIARWQIGRALLANGEAKQAYALIGPAAFRSAAVVPAMAWTAGLSAWRVRDYAGAQRFFTEFANRRGSVPAEAAMGAFWAARASLAADRPQFVPRFMRLAAATGDNFYGRLARAVLGGPLPGAVAEDGLGDRATLTLLKYVGGRRALALAQIGRPELAELEIRGLALRQDDPLLAEAIWKLTEAMDLPPAAAVAAASPEVEPPGSGDYPVPKLQNSHFTLDRALVLAVIRAESGFDQLATSSVGALGLMQLMPATAATVAERKGIRLNDGDLHDPLVNLKLGQGYLEYLMEQKEIGPNLILLAAAYNAGPGRVTQWLARDPQADDPLYFLESIPLIETRNYVKKVLSAYWAYQERFSQAATSLDELRLGSWPTYRPPGKARRTAAKS
ncbi:MAG TPA: lytic transglycosylase domain-containing protein [Geminicoccus sp.]|uniref:lytic transglycosylase domain-containing protein n=1 Tax=Geminicoccus sp. TaxID=2024832 RepID=UPI002C11CC78|nr:lytic transglycosylase domain-containing protein [Geminicoccus sp.]HWL71321.1 lytic transglycosylase domain-containing protein [Geminicoccus sp.]